MTWEQDSGWGAGEAGCKAPEEGGRWKGIVQWGRGVCQELTSLAMSLSLSVSI